MRDEEFERSLQAQIREMEKQSEPAPTHNVVLARITGRSSDGSITGQAREVGTITPCAGVKGHSILRFYPDFEELDTGRDAVLFVEEIERER